jgi:hypothetical protein
MNESPRKPLQKREWIFLLFLLVLAQLIVHMVAWRFCGSPNALGYVSFAGTIISIVLALLAIVYAFYQSYEQTRTSSSLASQIHRLHDVIQTFQGSALLLSKQLNELGNISEGITRTVKMSDEFQQQFGMVHARLDELKNFYEESKAPALQQAPSSTSSDTPDKATLGILVEEMPDLPYLALLSICVGATKKLKSAQEVFDQLYLPASKAVQGATGSISRDMQKFLDGYFFGIARAFNALIRDSDDAPIAVDSAFSQLIKDRSLTPIKDEWDKLRKELLAREVS